MPDDEEVHRAKFVVAQLIEKLRAITSYDEVVKRLSMPPK